MRFLSKISTKLNTASIQKTDSSNSKVKAYYSALAATGAVAAATSPLFAIEKISSTVKTSLQKVYGAILGISTAIAITFIAICLIIRMVSKNQRAVEEATAWIKRIAITWLILNGLGLFVTYGQQLVQGHSASF